MSLLKLLFDLPEAGGESNFTVEEQEELMAFEHNLDEHLQENFDLPVSEDFAFFQGTAAFKDDDDGGRRSLEECGGGVDLILPDPNGVNHHDSEERVVVSVGNAIEPGKMPDKSVVVETTTTENNGIGFENSTIIGHHHLPSLILEDYAPIKEHGAEFENSTARGLNPSGVDDGAPMKGHGVGFENPDIINPIPSSLEDVAPMNVHGVGFENSMTSEPFPSSLESNVLGKEHVASAKHSGSGQSLWLKVFIIFRPEILAFRLRSWQHYALRVYITFSSTSAFISYLKNVIGGLCGSDLYLKFVIRSPFVVHFISTAIRI